MALLASAGCVSIPNSTDCTVAGRLSDGMICAETNTGKRSVLTFDEMIEFLEPQETPKRAGAICTSTADYVARKNAIEQACRELGKRCSYQLKQLIKGMQDAQALK